MSSIKEQSKIIPGFSPFAVFDAGSYVETLPELEGLSVTASADKFALGVDVGVGISIIGHDFQIVGSVTEFRPAELIVIYGRSHIGEAVVRLSLSPHEKTEGTKVDYGLKINHSWSTKFFEHIVSENLNRILPIYTDAYVEKILKRLGANAMIEGK